jgi:hypothetical protein
MTELNYKNSDLSDYEEVLSLLVGTSKQNISSEKL